VGLTQKPIKRGKPVVTMLKRGIQYRQPLPQIEQRGTPGEKGGGQLSLLGQSSIVSESPGLSKGFNYLTCANGMPRLKS